MHSAAHYCCDGVQNQPVDAHIKRDNLLAKVDQSWSLPNYELASKLI